MTITAYFDVYPGMNPESVYFMTRPLLEKPAYVTRYKVQIEIEDPNLVDREVAPENVTVEKNPNV